MSANVKFRIGGKVYDNVVDAFSVAYSYDETTSTVIASASSDIQIRGELADRFREEFYGDCEGRQKRLPVDIIPTCTDELQGYELKANGIVWAPGACEATLTATRREGGCFESLKDSVYWKGGLSEAFESGEVQCPKVWYCVQMGPFLAAIVWSLRSILLPILGVLEAIENTLNFFGLNINIPSLDDFDRILTGCGRYHNAPLIKDIIEYRIRECGLTFSSSILIDDPVYQNCSLFEAAIEKGTKYNENVNFNENNSNNLTIGQLLDGLSEAFNAEYRVINGVLYFERKDFYDNRRDKLLVNLETAYPDRANDPAEYVINTGVTWAYFRGEYQKDRLDTQGDRLLTRNYSDIVEWNDPPQPIGEEWQKGEKSVKIPFAGVRCMFDNITCDKDDGNDAIDRRLDRFRENRDQVFLNDGGSGRKRAVIMERHYCQANKVLVLEPGFDYDDAHVIRRKSTTFKGTQCYDYNYPMYMDAEYDIPELYQSFHYIDDPRQAPYLDYYAVTGFEYAPADFCATAKLVNENFADLYVDTALGRGYPDKVELDFDKCIVTIEKIRIPCR